MPEVDARPYGPRRARHPDVPERTEPRSRSRSPGVPAPAPSRCPDQRYPPGRSRPPARVSVRTARLRVRPVPTSGTRPARSRSGRPGPAHPQWPGLRWRSSRSDCGSAAHRSRSRWERRTRPRASRAEQALAPRPPLHRAAPPYPPPTNRRRRPPAAEHGVARRVAERLADQPYRVDARTSPSPSPSPPPLYAGWVAIWIRLPQVSSKTAVVTGPMSSGSWRKRTPSPRRRSYSASTSATANWASGMPSSRRASR